GPLNRWLGAPIVVVDYVLGEAEMDDDQAREQSRSLSRRSFLGTVGVAAGAAASGALPGAASAALTRRTRRMRSVTNGEQPVPPVIRSRRELEARGIRFPQAATAPTALPITQNGTTYEMAQETIWLDSANFAVGRWDGSMSIFQFETAPFVGPMIDEAVNDPSAQGVQMITKLAGTALATSNDYGSILLWTGSSSAWND